MITLHQLEERYKSLPTALFDIVVELRNLVQQIAPGVTEELRPQGLVYYWAERGGPVSAGICQILIKTDLIQLAFNHGSFLPDPAGLLEGDRLVKRWTCIRYYDHARWADLKALIEASSRFDPYTLSFRKN